MKVLLLGAPGSGKTTVARMLVERQNKKLRGTELPRWKSVDGYVDFLKRSTERPFGVGSDLRGFIQVMGERWTREDALQAQGLNSITCGGLYETFILASARAMGIPFLEDESLIIEENFIANVTGSLFGILDRQTFDYNVVFYLPLGEEEESWNGVVDAKLPEVLEGFGRYAVKLEGKAKEKVERATEIIEAIQDASDNEREAVPEDDSPGEGEAS